MGLLTFLKHIVIYVTISGHIGLRVQSVLLRVFNTQFRKHYLTTNHYVACNAAFPAFERVFP